MQTPFLLVLNAPPLPPHPAESGLHLRLILNPHTPLFSLASALRAWKSHPLNPYVMQISESNPDQLNIRTCGLEWFCSEVLR